MWLGLRGAAEAHGVQVCTGSGALGSPREVADDGAKGDMKTAVYLNAQHAVVSALWKPASASTQGGGRALSGPASPPGRVEPPRATQCALRRRRTPRTSSLARGALPWWARDHVGGASWRRH